MPIRAAVAGQAGVHQPQAVEQLRPRAEGAADPRHAGPLVEGQGRRDIQHLVHIRPGRLGHPASCVGGQGPSRYRREPSAYRTPSAREDFPEPETPAMPTIWFSGNFYVNIFSNCGLWRPGPGSCPAYAPATSFYPSFLPPFQGITVCCPSLQSHEFEFILYHTVSAEEKHFCKSVDRIYQRDRVSPLYSLMGYGMIK